MIGEIAVSGVLMPALLPLGVAALILAGLLSRLFQLIGVYRFVAYRPIVDCALFVFLLGLLARLSTPFGLHP